MAVRTNIWPKSVADAAVTTFVFLIIPVVYYFELFVVLPKYYEVGSSAYCFHFVTGTFILWNICTNLVAIMMFDTSIKGRIMPSIGSSKWKFCSICESVTPPRSWHCNTCNVCILKRDHHCMFTSCCIGHFNQRYFMVFVFYMFIATVYASYYNIYFIADFVEYKSWKTILKIVFPLASLFVHYSVGQLFIFIVLIVILGGVFTGTLLYFHLNLISKGAVSYERKCDIFEYDLGIKENFLSVFGRKWYLIWLSPFIESPLDFDGMNWEKKQSLKVK